jgi:predicted peptidase
VEVEGAAYPYVLYVPREYDGSQKWPLIVFLHGYGERGDDGVKQTLVGIGPAIMRAPERFPALVLMPQCPASVNPKEGEDLLEVVIRQVYEWFPIIDASIEDTLENFSVNEDRIYLTGLSMGAFTSWRYAARRPDRFAAMMPICGAGEIADAPALAKLPIWNFHGDADQIVPVKSSREMVEAVHAAGGDVRHTEYPGVDHNSWDAAYNDAEAISWLLSQTK